MNPEREVATLLEQSGAVLVRSKKHLIWRLPNGNTFTQASTPSDHMAAANQLSDLRHALGISDPERGAPGERREHKPGREATPPEIHSAGRVTGSFAEKLSAAGLVEDSLREDLRHRQALIDHLNQELERAQQRQKLMAGVIQRLTAERCWWCRLKAYWRHRRAVRATQDHNPTSAVNVHADSDGRRSTTD